MQIPRHLCKVRLLINSKANTRIAQPGFISVVCYVWYHCCLGPMRPERIPLFPLNVVLLPGAEMPLHIFEPRYRQMVKDCLEENLSSAYSSLFPKALRALVVPPKSSTSSDATKTARWISHGRPRPVSRGGAFHGRPAPGRPRGLIWRTEKLPPIRASSGNSWSFSKPVTP